MTIDFITETLCGDRPRQAAVIDTPMMPLVLIARDDVVVSLTGHRHPRAYIAQLAENEAVEENSHLLGGLQCQVRAYFSGRATEFHAQVDISYATDFGQKVLRTVGSIAYGQTRSYGEVAAEAGSPRAARAVGQVMGHNRTLLLIPCHRVIGADKQLGGFSAPGGDRTKRYLLDLENNNAAAATE